MRHITAEEAMIAGLLRATRTIAVVGASPRPTRHSHEVVSYLHRAGFDVVPVRPDRATVAGLPTFASLDDFGVSVDMVVIFRRPDAVLAHIEQAVAKQADAVWLPPGAWSREAEEAARTHNLTLVKNRCIIEEHQHLVGATGEPTSGHPRKQGAYARRRRRRSDEQVSGTDSGYVEGGGGGHTAGGGKHSVLDEKNMTSPHRKRR
jgi:predicted CoA-binding protein